MTRPPLPLLTLATVTLVVMSGCTATPIPEPTQTAAPTTSSAPTTPPTTAPAPSPSPTLAWPTALDEQSAMTFSGTYSVVWLETAPEDQADALDAVQQRAEDLGYAAAATPVTCVDPAPADLLVADDPSSTWGAPVYFEAASDAELFVDLWPEPVAAVVHDVHLACDWN